MLELENIYVYSWFETHMHSRKIINISSQSITTDDKLSELSVCFPVNDSS